MFSLLKNCRKRVFISGPPPMLSSQIERFSRPLSPSTWLQSASRTHNFVYIDNFSLFWNHSSFSKAHGVHPHMLGNCIFMANIHVVQFAPQDLLLLTIQVPSSESSSLPTVAAHSPVSLSSCPLRPQVTSGHRQFTFPSPMDHTGSPLWSGGPTSTTTESPGICRLLSMLHTDCQPNIGDHPTFCEVTAGTEP